MPAKEKNREDTNLLPQNIEAEEAVLGAILVNPRVITKVVEILKPDSFYKPAHRYVYEAMLHLFNSNEKIDLITVCDTLNFSQKLDAAGGRSFINDLSYNAITTANVEYYAKIIQEKAIKRALINAGSEIVSFGYDMNPIDTSLDSAERLIFDIASRKVAADLIPVKDLVLETYEKIEYRYEHKDELWGIPTDFYELDAILNGLQRSDLIILAARPAMGKTTLALNIAQNVAIKTKIPVAIFSLEMSKQQLVHRMLCSFAELDAQRLKTGNMQAKDWEKLADAMNKFAQAPIYIDDTSGCTLTDIRAKCRRLKMTQKDLGLVIIDYLQLMEGSNNKEDRFQAVSTISRGLKTLAKELDVPVIALSQLSRAVESRTEKRPMLSDLRESGSIEQDADIVLFIYRDEYYRKTESDEEFTKAAAKGESEIIIAKHRNGPVGMVKLLFQGNITKFKNPIKTNTL